MRIVGGVGRQRFIYGHTSHTTSGIYILIIKISTLAQILSKVFEKVSGRILKMVSKINWIGQLFMYYIQKSG